MQRYREIRNRNRKSDEKFVGANKEMQIKNESIRSQLFRIKQHRTMRHRKILRRIWPKGPKSQ